LHFFEENYTLPECKHSRLVHKKCVELELSNEAAHPKLFIAGLGGSVPSYHYPSQERAWVGYPYTTDDALKQDFEPFICTALEQVSNAKGSLILFTHNGPLQCATAKYHVDLEDEPIESGSASILNTIKSKLGVRKLLTPMF